jgi:hypothetical protein
MSAQFQQPDFSGMNDPLGFVKKLWGDMQLPGMVTPTVSIDELDKKIQDLKTVESWLNVNMNMLKGTIQAFEVQRATIATLKSMGESFAQQMHAANSNFDQHETQPHEGHIRPDWPMPESSTQTEPEVSAPTEDGGAKASAASAAAANKAATNGATASNTETPFGSPAAWWGLLQDQFKQAVSQAVQSDQQVSTEKFSAKTPAPGTAKSTKKPSGRANTFKKTAPAAKAQASKKAPAKASGTANKKAATPQKSIVRKKN